MRKLHMYGLLRKEVAIVQTMIAVACASLTVSLATCCADERLIRADDADSNLQLARDLLRQASELAGEQDESQDFWTSRLLLQIGEVQIRAGDFEGARQSIRNSTYGYGRNAGLVQLAQNLAGTGQWEEGFDVLRETDSDRYHDRARVNDGVRLRWLDYLITTRDLTGSQDVVAQIESGYYRPEGYRRLAVAYAEAGDQPTSDEYFRLALVAAGEISGYASAKALWETAEAQRSVGAVDAAKATTRQLVDEADDMDPWAMVAAFREAAVLSALFQDRAAADSLFRRAVNSRQTVNSMNKVRALMFIAVAQARVGEVDAAQNTIDMITRGPERQQALAAVVDAELNRNDPDAAERIALSITDYVGYRDDSLNAIVDYHIAEAEFDEALNTAHNVHSRLRRASAILKVATAYAQSGDPVTAADVASQVALTNESFLIAVAERPVFDYRRPDTWGSNYDSGRGGTNLSRRLSDERTAEIAKWAMTLAQVMSLEPTPDYAESLNELHSDRAILALARAHAASGDVRDASAWAQRIGSDQKVASSEDFESLWALRRRINALIGVAEGILDRPVHGSTASIP